MLELGFFLTIPHPKFFAPRAFLNTLASGEYGCLCSSVGGVDNARRQHGHGDGDSYLPFKKAAATITSCHSAPTVRELQLRRSTRAIPQSAHFMAGHQK